MLSLISSNNYHRVILCVLLVLLPSSILIVNFLIIPPYFREYNAPLKKHLFDIQRAHIISLHPESVGELLSSIQHFLQIPNASVLLAVNGSQAGTFQDLPLYTQYLMLSGLILDLVSGTHSC